MVTVLIAGGGTGGHVFPMLAVGDAIKRIEPAAQVIYVGTSRGMEARVVPERGDTLELLDILPLRGGGLAGFARGTWRAASSIPAARALVRRVGPAVVLSVGGYAAGPVSLAARSLGVPLAVLEPNSALGLANRLLSPLASRAYTAFPEVERYFRPSIVRREGVPIRAGFRRAGYEEGEGSRRVLILGGSQGAKALNETVPRSLARLEGVEIVHQTGRAGEAAVRSLYAELGLGDRARVLSFIDDVPAALGRARLVIARAGASSVSELCAVGRPSVLVPYPFAADDHQMKNARSLAGAGAAVAIAQSEATEERLTEEIGALLGDPDRRAKMAAAASALGRPDAAETIAKDLLALGKSRTN